jgi:hypothetical protein
MRHGRLAQNVHVVVDGRVSGGAPGGGVLRMLMRMLMALRIQRGGGQWAEVGSGHCEVGNLKARIVGCHGGGYERGEGLSVCQSQRNKRRPYLTYRVLFAHVVLLAEEGLLGLHLLHIAVRVAAVHLDTVGRGGHALVRSVHVVLRLGEGRGAGLAELSHAVVEREAVRRLRHAVAAHVGGRLVGGGRAVVVVLAHLRGEVVQRAGQVGQRGRAGLGVFAIAVGEFGEVDVEVVEVDQVAKRLLCGRVHGLELLRIGPRLAVHSARRDPGGQKGRNGRVLGAPRTISRTLGGGARGLNAEWGRGWALACADDGSGHWASEKSRPGSGAVSSLSPAGTEEGVVEREAALVRSSRHGRAGYPHGIMLLLPRGGPRVQRHGLQPAQDGPQDALATGLRCLFTLPRSVRRMTLRRQQTSSRSLRSASAVVVVVVKSTGPI